DSKQKIARLQTEVQEYESSLKEIGNDMLSLKQDITEKVTLKESLRDKIEHFTLEINDLKEEIAHFQGIEESYQNTFNQLKSNMELLEKQFEEKGLEIEQSEYDELVDQLSLYQNQMEELKKEMVIAREKEDNVLAKQLTEMQQEIEILEQVLVEKENKWNRQNQENKELISSLKNQLADYQEEIEVVKVDSSLLKEEVAAHVELQQERMARIKDREEQILELTFQIEEYAKKTAEYEKRVNQLRVKLQQQENITYQEQQEIMDNLISLAAERDKIQDNINQYHAQINKLQSEIVELKDKIALMEKEEDRQFYEVRSGDCLWTIARDRYSEGIAWTKIFKANQELIGNPDLIYPYQQIILPE
ncbi:MAG: LysM peptidoglycan-binding domain-containing protein, partial [Atribacterota bacterium]